VNNTGTKNGSIMK